MVSDFFSTVFCSMVVLSGRLCLNVLADGFHGFYMKINMSMAHYVNYTYILAHVVYIICITGFSGICCYCYGLSQYNIISL